MSDKCPDCGSETGKRGWIRIEPKSVGSVALFGREILCTNSWHDIGIPNVPAIAWEYEQRISRERLDAGKCPKHNIPMIETEQEEYCSECEAER